MGNTTDVSLLSTGPHSEDPELTQRSRERVWSTVRHMAAEDTVSNYSRCYSTLVSVPQHACAYLSFVRENSKERLG